jgi:hypothetical protein
MIDMSRVVASCCDSRYNRIRLFLKPRAGGLLSVGIPAEWESGFAPGKRDR